MSKINILNLTFAYDGSYDNVFEDVSLCLDTDWKLGIVGRNGRGKTTLLKLLMGQFSYSGTISTSVDFQYFPVDVTQKTRMTIEILEDIAEFEYWQISKELSLLGVDENVLYRTFNSLSGGEQTKALLAAQFLAENTFLLIDEPTNHLDQKGRELLAKYLQKKKGFILVSHDRMLLDGCADHILSINKTDIDLMQGDFSTWRYNTKLKEQHELRQNNKLKKEIDHLNQSAKQSYEWSNSLEKTKFKTRDSGLRPDRGFIGHKSAKMMKLSKNLEARQNKAIIEKSGLLKNAEQTDSLKITHLKYHSSELLSLEKVGIYYDEKNVCSNVSFVINAGDRIALTGRNGSGKSSILRLLCKEKIEYNGVINMGSRLVVSYVSQDSSYLEGNLSDYAGKFNIDESLFKTILHKLGFTSIQFEKDMKDFSAGQKKKVLIARSLCKPAHLYVWDEPLNYIDVLSRIQIEEMLLSFKPTIIFVEHDKCFCERIATKIVSLD